MMNEEQTDRVEELLEKLASFFQVEFVTAAEALTVLTVYLAILAVRLPFDALSVLETAQKHVKVRELRTTIH